MAAVCVLDVNETLLDLTALDARPGKVLDPLADPPGLVVTDLDELATRLLA